MDIRAAEISAVLKEQIANFGAEAEMAEVGRVLSVGDGIARVYGLDEVESGELVEFEDGTQGPRAEPRDRQRRRRGVRRRPEHPRGRHGQADQVDRRRARGQGPARPRGRCAGRPDRRQGPDPGSERRLVDVKAPGIIPRQSVNEPMLTGLKAIDALIPIGRGQRELIIGDRQTGKSAIIDRQLHQPEADQRGGGDDEARSSTASTSRSARSAPRLRGWSRRCRTTGRWNTRSWSRRRRRTRRRCSTWRPYAACAMGEYFRDNGMHAVIVYDDLSKQAVAYRQMSLLLRRPPGREAYPGDVFYLHSRLLERAAKLNEENGGGSLTALPVVETQANDVSAYIPTNVISITDGQIFLETDAVLPGHPPGGERGPLGQPGGLLGADQGDEEGRGLDQARAGAVPRDGGLRPVRLGPRRRHPAPPEPRLAADRAPEAAAVPADADGRGGRRHLRRRERLPRHGSRSPDIGRFEQGLPGRGAANGSDILDAIRSPRASSTATPRRSSERCSTSSSSASRDSA